MCKVATALDKTKRTEHKGYTPEQNTSGKQISIEFGQIPMKSCSRIVLDPAYDILRISPNFIEIGLTLL